jgi:tetratricopeptide (TPR) repeat protein
MNRVIGLAVVLCGVVAIGAGCGGAKQYLAVERQVELAPCVRSLKAVAVLPADEDSPTKQYGDMLTDQLQSWLFDRFSRFQPHPELAARDAINKVIQENSFTRDSLADKKTAVETGRLLGAGAVIYGKVGVAISETSSVQAYPVPHTVVHRSATVTVTLTMASVETGAIVHTTSITKKQGWLGSPESTVGKAIEQCVMAFGEGLVPPTAKGVYEIKLAGSGEREIKEGNTYATVGNCEAAAERFEAASKAKPDSHVAHYNLAVMRLFLNDRAGAEAGINQALNLKVDKNYAWAQSILKEVGPEGRFRKATQQEIEESKIRGTYHKAP